MDLGAFRLERALATLQGYSACVLAIFADILMPLFFSPSDTLEQPSPSVFRDLLLYKLNTDGNRCLSCAPGLTFT